MTFRTLTLDAEIQRQASARRAEILASPTVPPREPLLSSGIDPEMRAANRWMCWKWERDRRGLWTKISAAADGRSIDATKPENWECFADAAIALGQNRNLAGVAFVLGGGFLGLDLDKCVHDGQITRTARRIIDLSGGYAELSPTKTGVKIFSRGGLAGKAPKSWAKSLGLDIYEKDRFFTVTGMSCYRR